jgi:hypothetical protein
MPKKNKQRTMQLWEIPLRGGYCFEFEKGDHTKEDIEQIFWTEHSLGVDARESLDVDVDEIKVVEEWEEDE